MKTVLRSKECKNTIDYNSAKALYDAGNYERPRRIQRAWHLFGRRNDGGEMPKISITTKRLS
jgi:hypothetical protein